MAYKEILTTRQAAAYCGVSVSFMNKARVRGDGPPFLRTGRAVRYRVAGKAAAREHLRARAGRPHPGACKHTKLTCHDRPGGGGRGRPGRSLSGCCVPAPGRSSPPGADRGRPRARPAPQETPPPRPRSPPAASAAPPTAAPRAANPPPRSPLAAASKQPYHPPWRVLPGDVDHHRGYATSPFIHQIRSWPRAGADEVHRPGVALPSNERRAVCRGRRHPSTRSTSTAPWRPKHTSKPAESSNRNIREKV